MYKKRRKNSGFFTDWKFLRVLDFQIQKTGGSDEHKDNQDEKLIHQAHVDGIEESRRSSEGLNELNRP